MVTGKDTVKEKESLIHSAISIILAVVGGIGTILVAYLYHSTTNKSVSKHASYDVRIIQNELIETRRNMNAMQVRLDALDSMKDSATAPLTAEVVSVNKSLDDIKNRLTSLERIIIQDPVKSLEVPFLKKDLDSVRENNIADIEEVREDIDKMYSLIVGSIITLVIAMLTPLVQNILSYQKELKSKKEVRETDAQKVAGQAAG